jgi:mycothiol synthase
LDTASRDAAEALIARAAAADGIEPVSEQALPDVVAEGTLRSVREIDGQVAAYTHLTLAHAEHPAMAEIAVDPRFRGRGLGIELVRAALERGGPGAGVWAHGDRPAARAVAARLGLAPARQLLQMRRSLREPLPDLVVPEGVALRTYAGPDDDTELLRINNAAFAWHPEQGGWTEDELAARRAEPWWEPAGLWLAVEASGPRRMLGFHWTKVHPGNLGEVYVVAVDPAAQGRGLGRVLTLAGLCHLREKSLDAVLLYTEADNVAAVRTYEKLGFSRFRVDVAYASDAGERGS